MKDKVVVVTGAFGALGSAVARAFATQGAAVALIDVGPKPPAALESLRGPRFVFRGGVDLSSLDAATQTLTAIAAELGGIDALINVAGSFRWQTLSDGDLSAWDFLYSVNLKTAVVATKAALPHLFARGAGAVVNIGAAAAAGRAVSGMGPYTASKSGVHRFTESLADELKDRAIRVNAVLPGTLDTPANRQDMPTADFSRWVAPADLAEVVLFLVSDAAKAVTGASIPVLGRG